MNQKILIVLGLVWSVSGFSQRVLSDYSPPQKVVVPDIPGASIRMLPGFHANANDGSYNGSNNKFVAKIGDPSETILPSSTIGDTGASLTDNYVYTRSYLVPVTLSNSYAPQIQSITYFDGLGRPKQNISIKSTSGGNDIVTKIEYDAFGRLEKDFLRMPQQGTTNSAFYGSVSESIGATLYGIAPYYSKKDIENSPLDRPNATTAPGEWSTNNKKITYEYQANSPNEVLRFVAKNATPVWTDGITKSILSLSVGNYYLQASLYKNKVTDEDNNISYEYKNGQGQTILVRKMTSTVPADTYYVYNEYDQLAFVISPLAANEIKSKLSTADLGENSPLISGLCYQYRYDGRNRLAEKKLPGKGWEHMVYDKTDRLILTQDANLRADNNKWLLTKYDTFGRVVYTGIYPGTERADMQVQAGGLVIVENPSSSGFTKSGLKIYYDNVYFTGIETVLSVNYYDTYPPYADLPAVGDYDQYGQKFLKQTYTSTEANPNTSISTKNLPTASMVKSIDGDTWTKSYTFYDQKARPIYTHTTNHLGGYTKAGILLDFSGVVLKNFTQHKRNSGSTSSEVNIKERFVYDYQNRLMKHYHQVDGNSEVLLTNNTYDELGRLTNKKVGNDLQSIDYDYNIRGWMTGINLIKTDPLKPLDVSKAFAYKVKYTNPDNPSMGTAKYNGNIAEVDWTYGSNNKKRYGYIYDDLNRLIKANYQEFNLTTSSTPGYYDEEVGYDLNGNITTLNRFAIPIVGGSRARQVDKLKYYYENGNFSNRLWKITDNEGEVANSLGYPGGGGTITYDGNGNMTRMPDKGIIQPMFYNHLNLPKQIEKSNSQLNYNYLANGTKISKSLIIRGDFISDVVNTDYLDGFVYTTAYSYGLAESLRSDDPSIKEIALAGQEEALELEDKEIASKTTFGQAVLEFIPTAEGFYDYKNSKYIYQYKDHLGNVRLSYSRDSSTGALKSEDSNSYYPFGLNHIGARSGGDVGSSFSPSTTYKNYKYNGKELQETGMYDYGARMYMPDIGRWGVHDPLSDATFQPYNYANNNPVFYNDPTGMIGNAHASTDVIRNKNGSYTVVGAYDDGDKNIYVVNNEKEKKRTGEVIGQTMQPCDFCSTNDATGGYRKFDKSMSGVTFDLNNLTVSGTAKDNKGRSAELEDMDAAALLEWIKQYYMNTINGNMPGTAYGWLEVLRELSTNDAILDIKASMGLPAYTAIGNGKNAKGEPIITTLRALGNMGFGANMLLAKPPIVGKNFWYGAVMNQAGQYNQSHNGGNGYNKYFPYFGEHSYSGGYIYFGYFRQFYKK